MDQDAVGYALSMVNALSLPSVKRLTLERLPQHGAILLHGLFDILGILLQGWGGKLIDL